MAVLLYKIFLFFYAKGIGVYALFNRKARMWRNGRKQLLILITTTLQDLESPLIWFHCSSLGEFEQGRPIIELLRSQYKDHKILLTFFSPSGYEVQKNYKEADYVFYLPIDSAGNAEKFLSITKPVLVIFVKYEYWYYYLKAVYEKGIPLILVSAVFNRSQPFFKWYGSLHRKMLGYFTKIFVQDSLSAELVNKIGNLPISIAGDTRFDRVSEISLHKSSIPFINAFKQDKQILIAGSTWPKDEEILYTVFQQKGFENIKLVIAPHEINKVNLASIRSLFKGAVFYSELNDEELVSQARYLVIDNVGMLSRLYQYGDVTYVGGGFSIDGIHNILEAATWGKPVLFGPNHSKFKEAENLIKAGGGKSFCNKDQLKAFLQEYFSDEISYKKASEAAQSFIKENKGATEKIIGYIQENRLLTNL